MNTADQTIKKNYEYYRSDYKEKIMTTTDQTIKKNYTDQFPQILKIYQNTNRKISQNLFRYCFKI